MNSINYSPSGSVSTQNGTAVAAYVADLVELNNLLNGYMIEEYAANVSDAKIRVFDAHSLFETMLANPTSFLGPNPELVNPCNACLLANCTGFTGCTDPQRHFWWDCKQKRVLGTWITS